jgi:hypothetical protein
MDAFDSVIFLWFASAMIVTAIGYFRGQAADAMTLGVLLGPVALVVVSGVLLMRGRSGLKESPQVLEMTAANRHRHTAAVPETQLRRAA